MKSLEFSSIYTSKTNEYASYLLCCQFFISIVHSKFQLLNRFKNVV